MTQAAGSGSNVYRPKTFNGVLDCLQSIADVVPRVQVFGYRTHDGTTGSIPGKDDWRGPYVFEVYASTDGLSGSRITELAGAIAMFGLDFHIGREDLYDEDSDASTIRFKPRLAVEFGTPSHAEERPERSDGAGALDRATALVLLDRLAAAQADCEIEVWRSSLEGYPRYLFDFKIGHLMRSRTMRQVLDILDDLDLEGWGDNIHPEREGNSIKWWWMDERR